MGRVTCHRTSDFGGRDELKQIDDDIERTCTLDVVKKVVLRGPYLDRSLTEQFAKNSALGTRNQRKIATALAKAIYDIPTCRGYFINAYVKRHGKREWSVGCGATVLPWADGGKETGPMYLCMNVRYPKNETLVARLLIVTLTVDGDRRTVLVTDHVCDRIEERAGIQGSHVSFIADSVVFNKVRIAEQPNPVRLLAIFDRDEKVIGYCPISKIRCGLSRTQDALALKGGRKFVKDQDRWRLKTFLPTEYFVERDDGVLVPKQPSEGKKLLSGEIRVGQAENIVEEVA